MDSWYQSPAGHLGVGEAGDVPAQAVHGRFVGQAGAGGRLIERRDQGLFLQQVHVAPVARNRLHPFRDLEHAEELLPLEFFERQNVTTSKATH